MGNDGGSIAKRVDLVKEKPKEIKKDIVSMNKNRSRYCSMSNQKLTKPIVVCKLGYLYNKESVLSALINKQMPSLFNHIKKLKDVKDVKAEIKSQEAEFPIVCPLSGLEFNGVNKFVVFWSCGCMISEKTFQADKKNALQKANKEDGSDSKPQLKCPLCGTPYSESQIIYLNQEPEQIEAKKKLLMAASKNIKKVEKEKEAFLGKRDPIEEEQPVGKEPEKKNILDKLAREEEDSQLKTYKGLFHQSKNLKIGDAKELFFRNVRFGLR